MMVTASSNCLSLAYNRADVHKTGTASKSKHESGPLKGVLVAIDEVT